MKDKLSSEASAARRAEALRANLKRRKAATRKAKEPEKEPAPQRK